MERRYVRALAVVGVLVGLIQPTGYCAGESVAVWYSSEDSENNAGDAVYRLSKQPDLAVQDDEALSGAVITIDTSVRYQTHLGFGIALDETACYFLSQLEPAPRAEVMNALFDPQSGSGINMLRLCIGTSDLTTREFYSYNDLPSGQTDPNLEHFSIQKDIDYNIMARLKDALAINPAITVFASPWSPPGWMKTSGSMVGGSLKSEYYGAFARYMVKFIQAYANEGIEIYAVTPQNEPDYVPSNYPGCGYSARQQIELVKEMGAAFEANDIDTKIWILDHTYNLWQSFAKAVLDDQDVNPYIDGAAFHPYVGDVDAMSKLHDAHPDKSIHFTEKSRKEVDGADDIIRDFRNWAESAAMWASVGDGQGTGCAHDEFTHCPVIVRSSAEYVLGDEVFIFGQFARFIQRGARRIQSDYGSRSTVTNVCYKNPDGSLVAVVCNQTSSTQSFKLVYEGNMVSAELPSLTVATLLWTPEHSVHVAPGGRLGRIDVLPGAMPGTVRIQLDARRPLEALSAAAYTPRGRRLGMLSNPSATGHKFWELDGRGAGIRIIRLRTGDTGHIVPITLLR
jgi:glucosylceramidase